MLSLIADKGESPDKAEEEEGDSDSSEEALAREAYAAIKDGDEEGFVQAFLDAVRKCAAGYEK